MLFSVPPEDGFEILEMKNSHHVLIFSPNARGVLYGVFAFLRKIALGEDVLENLLFPMLRSGGWITGIT